MNTVLWVVQGILAMKLIATAVSHVFQHHLETMQEAIQTFEAALPLLYCSGVLMFFGGLVLFLPAVATIPSWVIPITAAGIAVIMLASIGLHMVTREDPKIFVSLVLCGLAAFLAYGRWMLFPLT